MLFAETHKIINTYINNLQQNVYFPHIDTTYKQSTSQNHIKRTQRKPNAKTFFNFAFAFVFLCLRIFWDMPNSHLLYHKYSGKTRQIDNLTDFLIQITQYKLTSSRTNHLVCGQDDTQSGTADIFQACTIEQQCYAAFFK